MTTSPPAPAPLTSADVARLRADFPILGRRVTGHPLVYLDSGATSQRPTRVLDAERDYLEQRNSAVHRGAHTLAAEATDDFEDARARVAAFLGADPDDVVWTAGATAALNLVATAIGNASSGRGGSAADRFRLSAGDEILVTEAEHHANLIPWQELAARTGATLRWIELGDDGTLRLDDESLDRLITDRTRVIAVSHVSNVLGGILPLARITGRARAVGALVVLDACQSAPHLALDVRELDVDLLAFSGHKMLGPLGIGVLWGRPEVLAALPPASTGGSMITTVTMEGAQYLPPPQRFEPGTQPVSQAIALAAAVDYLTEVGMDRIAEHEGRLGARLVEGLSAIPSVTVLGPGVGSPRVGLAAFDVAGVHSHDVGQFLDDRGIAVRVGHHCAQPLHRRLGITSSTRASAYLYTTDDEIEQLLDGVAGAVRFFGAGS